MFAPFSVIVRQSSTVSHVPPSQLYRSIKALPAIIHLQKKQTSGRSASHEYKQKEKDERASERATRERRLLKCGLEVTGCGWYISRSLSPSSYALEKTLWILRSDDGGRSISGAWRTDTLREIDSRKTTKSSSWQGLALSLLLCPFSSLLSRMRLTYRFGCCCTEQNVLARFIAAPAIWFSAFINN